MVAPPGAAGAAAPLAAVGPFDPVALLLLAAGVALTTAAVLVAGYLLAGAFVDLFTRA